MKLKKLLYLLLISTLSLSLISCDDDEDYDSSIIGTWKLSKKGESNVSCNESSLAKAITQDLSDKWNGNNSTITITYLHSRTFNNNNTFEEVLCSRQQGNTIDSIIYTGTYTYENGIVSLFYEETTNKKGAQLRVIENSGGNPYKKTTESFEMRPKKGTFTMTFGSKEIYADSETNILKRDKFDELLLNYPDIMKDLANLTEEEIGELIVHQAEEYMTYKRQ